MDRVELILVGSEAQYRDWREMASEERRFRRVVTVEAGGVLYYELKNRGAARASGEIAAFIDSDVQGIRARAGRWPSSATQPQPITPTFSGPSVPIRPAV